jgi:predicted nucleic acid-binding protein
MTRAVLDAGPLIHLTELNALDVLGDFEGLDVPPAVWDEVALHQPEALTGARIHLRRVSTTEPSPELQSIARALALDRGELEALAYLETQPKTLFLTDDAAARLAAEQPGYQVHGTIGLLVRSVRRGLYAPPQVLNLLHSIPSRSTLFVRPSLLDAIIRNLEKEWPFDR